MSAPETAPQPEPAALPAPAPLPDPWESLTWLPCCLSVDLPVAGLSLRDLAALGPGSVVGTDWPDGSDPPVTVNGQRIGWAEFEVVGERLAIRMTEMA